MYVVCVFRNRGGIFRYYIICVVTFRWKLNINIILQMRDFRDICDSATARLRRINAVDQSTLHRRRKYTIALIRHGVHWSISFMTVTLQLLLYFNC